MSSYRTGYNGAYEPYRYSPYNRYDYRPSVPQYIAPHDDYNYRRPPEDHEYHRSALYWDTRYQERVSRNVNNLPYREGDRAWHRVDTELHRSPYAPQVSMSPFSSGPNYKPERLLYDHNAPGLRQLQNSLVQPFQRLLGDPINIAESRKPPTQSQNWFAESVPTVSSARNESTTAGSSYANLAPGYQPTAMPVDEVFASEIAAQRKTVADSRKIAEAAKWKRLREQRVARNEALAVQKAERAKWIAEEEASRKRHIAEPEAQRLKKTAEQEAQRMKQTSEREVEMENQRLAEEKAKSESQVLVEQGPDIGEQNHEKRRIPRQQRVKTNLQHEADRHHNMRAQEKLLEQVYKEHNIDVVKVETRSGGAMYAPWDSNVGDILDQQKQEELDRKGLYFWLEAGTAVSVSQNNDSLETTEDVTMSG